MTFTRFGAVGPLDQFDSAAGEIWGTQSIVAPPPIPPPSPPPPPPCDVRCLCMR